MKCQKIPKRLHLILFMIAFVLPYTAAMPAHAQEQRSKLRVAGSPWPPYIDQKLPNMGLSIDLVASIFERAGYDTVITLETWPRTLEGVHIGAHDVIAAAWYTPARNQIFKFSDPYFENKILFIKRKGTKLHFDTLNDLRNVDIGIVDGYAYDEKFDNDNKIRKVKNNYVIYNLIELHYGKTDLTLGDQWVIRHELAKYLSNAIEELEFLPKPLAKRELHIAVSRTRPDHEKIVAAFNRSLREMKRDGSYQTIIDKHFENLTKIVK